MRMDKLTSNTVLDYLELPYILLSVCRLIDASCVPQLHHDSCKLLPFLLYSYTPQRCNSDMKHQHHVLHKVLLSLHHLYIQLISSERLRSMSTTHTSLLRLFCTSFISASFTFCSVIWTILIGGWIGAVGVST